MSEATSISSLKTIFKFPFEDPNWRNSFLVGTLLSFAGFLVPVLPSIFVAGYTLAVMRQAIRGERLRLPAWDDWGMLGVDGLRVMLVWLAYFLPGLVVLLGGMGLYFGISIFAPLAMGVARESSDLAWSMPWVFLASMAVMFLSMFVGTILMLLGAIPLPLAIAHFIEQDRVSAAFQLRAWWPILKRNKLGYFIAWVVMTGLMGVLWFVTMIAYYSIILCFLIPLLGAPIGFYVGLVGAGVFGETYRESKGLGEPGLPKAVKTRRKSKA